MTKRKPTLAEEREERFALAQYRAGGAESVTGPCRIWGLDLMFDAVIKHRKALGEKYQTEVDQVIEHIFKLYEVVEAKELVKEAADRAEEAST
jgi:hypothetical protein